MGKKGRGVAARPKDDVEPEDGETADDESMIIEGEPEDDDPSGDRIELVRTGLVRVWINSKRFRLRRPFFGEYKTLRLAMEDVNDEIQAASDQAVVSARALAAVQGDDIGVVMDRRKESRSASRHLTETAEALRLEWWESMWKTLSVDGEPDDWPAWVMDAAAANSLMIHWRSSPLGRG